MVFSEDGGPSTVDQFYLLLRTPYLLSPITFSHKPRSRIKSGMTLNRGISGQAQWDDN